MRVTTRPLNTGADTLLAAIQAFAEPMFADMGLELVELQYRREGHGWVLRFFIDKEGGVTIDDCAMASREIGAYLEVEDLLDHAYHLEVSSPGLERPLKKRDDFLRFAGRLVRVKTHTAVAGQKVFVGTLARLDGDTVVLVIDGKEVVLEYANITKARLTLDA